MVDHFHKYIYQKRGFYYFSRRVPKKLYQHHTKQRIVLALNTRSKSTALKYAQVISQRLDNRWLPMRLDAMGLSDVVANDVGFMNVPTLSEATQQYVQLKGIDKPKKLSSSSIQRVFYAVPMLQAVPQCKLLQIVRYL